jgi:hypothetical protein
VNAVRRIVGRANRIMFLAQEFVDGSVGAYYTHSRPSTHCVRPIDDGRSG